MPASVLPVPSMCLLCKVKSDNLCFFFSYRVIFIALLSGFHRRRDFYKHFHPLRKSSREVYLISESGERWTLLSLFSRGRFVHCRVLGSLPTSRSPGPWAQVWGSPWAPSLSLLSTTREHLPVLPSSTSALGGPASPSRTG